MLIRIKNTLSVSLRPGKIGHLHSIVFLQKYVSMKLFSVLSIVSIVCQLLLFDLLIKFGKKIYINYLQKNGHLSSQYSKQR